MENLSRSSSSNQSGFDLSRMRATNYDNEQRRLEAERQHSPRPSSPETQREAVQHEQHTASPPGDILDQTSSSSSETQSQDGSDVHRIPSPPPRTEAMQTLSAFHQEFEKTEHARDEREAEFNRQFQIAETRAIAQNIVTQLEMLPTPVEKVDVLERFLSTLEPINETMQAALAISHNMHEQSPNQTSDIGDQEPDSHTHPIEPLAQNQDLPHEQHAPSPPPRETDLMHTPFHQPLDTDELDKQFQIAETLRSQSQLAHPTSSETQNQDVLDEQHAPSPPPRETDLMHTPFHQPLDTDELDKQFQIAETLRSQSQLAHPTSSETQNQDVLDEQHAPSPPPRETDLMHTPFHQPLDTDELDKQFQIAETRLSQSQLARPTSSETQNQDVPGEHHTPSPLGDTDPSLSENSARVKRNDDSGYRSRPHSPFPQRFSSTSDGLRMSPEPIESEALPPSDASTIPTAHFTEPRRPRNDDSGYRSRPHSPFPQRFSSTGDALRMSPEPIEETERPSHFSSSETESQDLLVHPYRSSDKKRSFSPSTSSERQSQGVHVEHLGSPPSENMSDEISSTSSETQSQDVPDEHHAPSPPPRNTDLTRTTFDDTQLDKDELDRLFQDAETRRSQSQFARPTSSETQGQDFLSNLSHFDDSQLMRWHTASALLTQLDQLPHAAKVDYLEDFMHAYKAQKRYEAEIARIQALPYTHPYDYHSQYKQAYDHNFQVTSQNMTTTLNNIKEMMNNTTESSDPMEQIQNKIAITQQIEMFEYNYQLFVDSFTKSLALREANKRGANSLSKVERFQLWEKLESTISDKITNETYFRIGYAPRRNFYKSYEDTDTAPGIRMSIDQIIDEWGKSRFNPNPRQRHTL